MTLADAATDDPVEVQRMGMALRVGHGQGMGMGLVAGQGLGGANGVPGLGMDGSTGTGTVTGPRAGGGAGGTGGAGGDVSGTTQSESGNRPYSQPYPQDFNDHNHLQSMQGAQSQLQSESQPAAPWDGLSAEQIAREIVNAVDGVKGVGEKIVSHL